jgi:hypothetical protein
MLWFAENADWISSLGLVTLTGLGIFVALIPNLPHRIERRYFASAFVIVGLITWRADVVAKRVQADALTGGENFCFLAIQIPKASADSYAMRLVNYGPGQVFKVAIGIYPLTENDQELDEGHWSAPLDIVYPTVVNQRLALPPGRYRIDFKAMNGSWQEFITLTPGTSMIGEKIDVRRNGTSIHSAVTSYPLS